MLDGWQVFMCVFFEVSAYTLGVLVLAVFPGRTFVTETSMFRCGCNPGRGHMVKIKHWRATTELSSNNSNSNRARGSLKIKRYSRCKEEGVQEMDLGPSKGVAMSKQGFTDPLLSVGIQFRLCFVFGEGSLRAMISSSGTPWSLSHIHTLTLLSATTVWPADHWAASLGRAALKGNSTQFYITPHYSVCVSSWGNTLHVWKK